MLELISLLDTRTTALLVAFAFFIQANAIAAQAFLIREYEGVGTALLGNMSLALGFLLTTLRGFLPDFVTIVIANFFLLFGVSVFYIAISRFTGQKYSKWNITILLISILVITIYFRYVTDDLAARIIGVSFCVGISVRARVTPQEGDRGHLGTERGGGTRDVQTLAAGHLQEARRPVDVALHEPLDLEQLVDRRVRPQADDHADIPRARNASTSSRVGWASTPPLARVDSAPQAAAKASASGSGRPSSEAARNPASNESPAPVVSTTSTRRAGANTGSASAWRARAPSPPAFTTTVPVTPRGAGRPRRRRPQCTLQDYHYAYNGQPSVSRDPKVRGTKFHPLSERIMLDNERCVACSRCVRFTREISKSHAIGIKHRADHSLVRAAEDGALDRDPYSDNVIDLCPVGALLSRQFLYKARVWYLQAAPQVCPGCERGCTVQVCHRKPEWRLKALDPKLNTEIARVTPLDNPAVNGPWICNKGRDLARQLGRARALEPMLKGRVATGGEAVAAARALIGGARKAVALVSSWGSNEEKRQGDPQGILHGALVDCW